MVSGSSVRNSSNSADSKRGSNHKQQTINHKLIEGWISLQAEVHPFLLELVAGNWYLTICSLQPVTRFLHLELANCLLPIGLQDTTG
jgi:hypothetical protein